MSRPGLALFAGRSLVALACIGCLTAVATWHAGGLVRSGEIDRMLRMGAHAPPPPVDTKPRGKLDKGRLNALAATAGR
ncbi:hypothetical protein [Enterovirga rhinocerotis]|uniref:Uncharacterized protein n=1 Tax=Enterovirga rhinocerotis TaxID=1339210 RepID=A0A4R7BKM6_9HYPH|nr:hypothetical protein [Enterovirga rhinocerotis]TDR85132.1 hypothetical protein EV668_4674 [Enterovirga rhinocerotis]